MTEWKDNLIKDEFVDRLKGMREERENNFLKSKKKNYKENLKMRRYEKQSLILENLLKQQLNKVTILQSKVYYK